MTAEHAQRSQCIAGQPRGESDLCPQTVFSTAAIPHRERFDAWRSLIGLTHELTTDEPAFSARLHTTQIGAMLVHVMDASSQAVHRTPDRVKRDGLDHIILHLSAVALGAVEGDREFFIPSGAVSINDVSRPHRRIAAPEQGSIILSLPRDLVADAVRTTDGLHGQILHQGLGGLLRDHLVALGRHASEMTRTAAPNLEQATIRMLAACVHPSADNVVQARLSLDAALVVRAKRYIEAHLASPGLTPDTVCRSLHVSRATLFRAFQPLGGVATYIWNRRLEAVRRVLTSGSRDPLATIGLSYGFTNSTHLSRSFRRQFGMSATEFREARDSVRPSLPLHGPTGHLLSDWVQSHG